MGQTLWKGGVPDGVPQKKNGLLRYYLPILVNFTHENNNFVNKKGVCVLPFALPLDPQLAYDYDVTTLLLPHKRPTMAAESSI